VRRFAQEMGPVLTDLLDLSRADVTSKRPGKRQRCMVMISELARRIREIEAQTLACRRCRPGSATC
jgi:poly(A) polymerase